MDSPHPQPTTPETLAEMLETLLRSGSTTNPALNAMLRDYTTSHAVLVLLGGVFLMATLWWTATSWLRLRRPDAVGTRSWTPRRRVDAVSVVLGLVVCAFLALVVLGNVSNVLDPRSGFAGTLSMIAEPRPDTRSGELHDAFTAWLSSGSTEAPDRVQAAVLDRLAWQRPKAVICTVLLILSIWSSVRVRSVLGQPSRADGRRGPGWSALRAAGWIAPMASVLFMLMVLGNVQASIAPLGLTLLHG